MTNPPTIRHGEYTHTAHVAGFPDDQRVDGRHAVRTGLRRKIHAGRE
ncbi:hypothetical protein SIM91_03800 [Rhodococcus opacus]|nr:hypothetical protein [Rhodococcus opacus]MDX5962465.1 hypothetical protein [Rhodococcus opacus]